jgi:putative nucleotidyltransferase with HDIG domain
MSGFHGKLLLIDNNNEFTKEVLSDHLIDDYPIIVQKTLPLGLKIYQSNPKLIRAVIVSTHFFGNEESLNDFFKSLGNTPCIFISHRENHALRGHFKGDRVINRPERYEDILSVVKKFVEKKADWKDFEENHDEKFVELNIKESEYISVLLNDFMIFPKSYFNVYIKIGRGNFIKIVNAGDVGAREIINRYSDKGFSHLYLPIIEHEKYVSLCEKMSQKTFNSMSTGTKEKLKNTFRLGNEVAKNITRLGIEPKTLDYAETFLDQSVSMIKNLNIKEGNLENFIKDIENNEHTTAVSFLSGVIADQLGFESLQSVKLVGIAALVHDIGLYDLSPDVDEKTLFPSSELMLKHPKHGADLIRKSGCFDDVIAIAVEQHHMRRRGGDTFSRSNNMNLVSEIVGVSDSFYNKVLKDGFRPQHLDDFLNNELKKFSHPIEKAVLKVLDKKRKAG